ncbi:MAG TPA: hypothetical protein VK717_01740 [Opitutaceae bacterium]|jgi:hypothetical protein|nr:hypothetical protein [Opitutaceae bacterium]
MSELRITDTNSANDSKGRAFGLEGNDFIYVLVALVLALGMFLLLSFLFGFGKLASLVLVAPILLGPLGWVVLLRHNKPEGYAEDWVDQKLNGEGWSFVAQAQPASPKERP